MLGVLHSFSCWCGGAAHASCTSLMFLGSRDRTRFLSKLFAGVHLKPFVHRAGMDLAKHPAGEAADVGIIGLLPQVLLFARTIVPTNMIRERYGPFLARGVWPCRGEHPG